MKHMPPTNAPAPSGPAPALSPPPERVRRKSQLALTLVVAVMLVALGLIPAGAQEDIDDARAMREQTREDELRARTALDILNAEYSDVEDAWKAADELVALSEARAVAIEAQLALVTARLNRIEVAIEWAEYDQEILNDKLADVAVQAYLGSARDESVLTESDLNEALVKQTVLDAVQGAGDDIINTARSSAEQYEDLQEQAQGEIIEIERLEAALLRDQETLEEARAVRAKARDALDSRRDEWRSQIEELEAEEDQLSAFIRSEQRKIDIQNALDELDAQRAQAALDALAATSTGSDWLWPTAGGIGSFYGWRMHPVLGYERLHGGLDIGGAWGQPIFASREGVVIMSGPNRGYGNTVIVDHGNGYVSLYAHQSTMEVVVGEWVEMGQHIGNVGSTGLSTGPHLHFEIRVDGNQIDPLPYLPRR